MIPSPRDPAQFTRESADRIAAVVRSAELTPPSARPLNFEAVQSQPLKAIRFGTYSGAWAVGGSQTVTLMGSTATASAINLFIALPSAGTRNCAIARDGTAWRLIQWQSEVTDVLSGASLGTAALEFTRVKVASLATASTVRITTTTCA